MISSDPRTWATRCRTRRASSSRFSTHRPGSSWTGPDGRRGSASTRPAPESSRPLSSRCPPGCPLPGTARRNGTGSPRRAASPGACPPWRRSPFAALSPTLPRVRTRPPRSWPRSYAFSASAGGRLTTPSSSRRSSSPSGGRLSRTPPRSVPYLRGRAMTPAGTPRR